MNLEGKKVLVVGLGKTGEALSQFLLKRRARVKISEIKSASEFGQKIDEWTNRGVEVETGRHDLKSFMSSDLIVPSPGVPILAELKAAMKKGIPVISEIELAFQFLKGKIVGVTGTNGKSTTVTLIHKILKEGKREAFLAGNIGTPLISFVETSQESHIYITEISSFQLEYLKTFRASVSIFLNVSPNHLDWHPSFQSYYKTKKKLFLFQKEGDEAILNRDDPLVWRLKKEGKAKAYGFSRKTRVSPGCFLQDGHLIICDQEEEKLMPLSEIRLPGAHNLENVMASALAAHLFGIPLPSIRESIKGFEGLEHRQEKVLTLRGVDFINDSKATTIEATTRALESYDRKMILILGGRDKGADFTQLRKPVKKKVKKAILIGEAINKIGKALKGIVPVEVASSLQEAVSLGFSSASSGDIVLLSPACTSFDMFKNFEERGQVFKKEVYELAKSVESHKT